jgi:hypothetical protein
MTRQLTTEKEERTANIGFAKWRVTCFYDTLVLNQSAVLRLNFSAENPPLRKAEKRYSQWKQQIPTCLDN